MAELLGIGLSHAPHLQYHDQEMANLLRRRMRDERTPLELRDPSGWPAEMCAEWGDDQGMRSAAEHRRVLEGALRRVRAELDAFEPDVVLIWGDDQYENFQVDLIPAFTIYALPEFTIAPFAASEGLKASANVWNAPEDLIEHLPGHQQAASYLTEELLAEGFDLSCAYAMRHRETLGHAFTRTLLYLDYDRSGWSYPVIPFHVNCYGKHLRIPPGEMPASADFTPRPPSSPPPWRCFDLGRAIGQALARSPWRVALVGSSSWSHGSLTAKHHFLYPDVAADRQRLEELRSGQHSRWRELTPEQIVESGQHEILNWLCLAGAMHDRRAEIVAYAQTYLFNSDKVVALFPA